MKLKAFYQNTLIEAGCDEAGRGCLAGPVVAAAVILPRRFRHPLLTDSKQLTAKQRNQLVTVVKANAEAHAIAEVSNEEIDQINILNASFEAMHRAIDKLHVKPGLLLIDGNRFNAYSGIPHRCIVKGDAKYYSIAAASILAKTYRDNLMQKLARIHIHYKWETNVGYPTRDHREAILNFGITPYHRKSFRLLNDSAPLE